MHIVIAAITAVAGLIWALNSLQRSGFDLNSLNPFYWARRRQWEKKQINPLYAIDSPRELAAVLMLAVLKQVGDPTAEQKAHLLSLYNSALKFDDRECEEMYLLGSHLLSTDPNYEHKIRDMVAPSLPEMSDSQRRSIADLVSQIATHSGEPSSSQADLIRAIKEGLDA